MPKLKDTDLTLDGCARCSCCQSIKPASKFYPDRSRHNGLTSTCRTCHAARQRIRRKPVVRDLRKLAEKHPRVRALLLETADLIAA
jgi:hypothetical protein